MGWVLPITVGRDPGSPSRSMEGCCRERIRGTPLKTNMRGLPMSTKLGCEYLIVHWPGLDVLSIFSNSGPDPGKSFPGSGGITTLPEVYDTMDAGPRKVSSKAGVESMQLVFGDMAPGNVADPWFFTLT